MLRLLFPRCPTTGSRTRVDDRGNSQRFGLWLVDGLLHGTINVDMGMYVRCSYDYRTLDTNFAFLNYDLLISQQFCSCFYTSGVAEFTAETKTWYLHWSNLLLYSAVL